MGKQTLLRIAFEYELSKMNQNQLEKLIVEELDLSEKKEILAYLSESKMRLVLYKIGYKQDFLKTI